jgi:hypothetical protein
MSMQAAPSYHEWMKQDLGSLIDALDLSDLHKHFLRSRWLDALLWTDGRAKLAQIWYYVLRLTAIIGGVIVPALVSVKMNNATAPELIEWLTFVLSLLVALSVAVDGFFQFGERWRHYRRVSELIKIEGWQFLQLSGPYSKSATHTAAYSLFAERIEGNIQSEVDEYITKVVQEKVDQK